MINGGGRYAYPSLFDAVEKFFDANTNISDGSYNLAKMVEKGIFTYKTYSDGTSGIAGTRVNISQYGTDIGNSDFVERAYIFGSTSFKLNFDNATFKVVNGIRTIEGMVVTASQDDFDFKSDNLLSKLVNNIALKPTLDPYGLGRGGVKIYFDGSGYIYNSYSKTDFLNDAEKEGDVSVSGSLTQYLKDVLGITSLVTGGEGISYFQNIYNDEFLSYEHGDLKVIYGTPNNDDINEFDAEVSSDIYFGFLSDRQFREWYIKG